MCERPFNVFKWKPGRGEGYRKTEVNGITRLPAEANTDHFVLS